MSRSPALLCVVLALSLLVAACSSDEDEPAAAATSQPEAPQEGAPGAATDALETIPLPGATATPSAPPAGEPEARPSPPHREVEITSPSEGATVASPVTLEVRVEGFSLAPIDGSFEDDSGHLYAYLDRRLPTTQDRFPEDVDIVRFAETEVVLPELEPGEHTVGVIASHGYPVPMMPIVADEVTFTVE